VPVTGRFQTAMCTEEIGEVVRQRIGRAAGVSAVAVGGDLDRVQVDIEAARPGVGAAGAGGRRGRTCGLRTGAGA
jgi:ribosomal protein S3